MMGRLSRIGLDVVLICALSALVLVVVGGWRLSHGPVSLGFLKPYAEERFAALDLPYEIAFSDIVLAWGGTSRPLGLAILDAELRSEEERAVARIPEVSLGLSLPSLLDGKFVLKTVELSEAGVEVIRYADGGLGVGLAGEGAGTFMLFELDAADRSGASLMGRLDHLAIHRAAISIDDRVLGLHMNADRASLDFERHEDAIVCVFDIDSVSAEERLALGGVAEYRLSDGTMHAALDFRDLVPGRYAQVLAERFPDLPDISGIAVPLRGRVEASADPDGALKQASFTVSGTEGSLRLAALDGHRYDFRSLVLDGRYAAGDGSVAVDRLDIDFGAPRLSLSGKLGRVDGIARLAARAKLDGMTMAALGRYWPEGVAAGTRRWLIANLDRGEVRDLAADFAAAFPAAGAKIEHAEVTFAVDAARVHYFRPLPPIIDAGASIAIDRDRVRIAVSGGKVEDLVLADGRIDIAGLSTDEPHLALEANLSGPVSSALSVLDRPPLGYASKVGLAPADAGGALEMRITARFPLIEALALADIALGASGTTAGASANGVFFGQNLTEGALRFVLDDSGMKIDGKAHLSGIPAVVGWREDFSGTAEPRRRYTVRARLTEPDRERLGVVLAPTVQGPLAVEAAYEAFSGGAARVAGTLDIAETSLALAPLGLWKPPGVAGRATFSFGLDDGKARTIRIQDLAAGDIRAAAQVRIESGHIRKVEIDRLSVAGRYDFAGALAIDEAGGWTIDARGRLFDAAPLQRFLEAKGGGPLPSLRIDAQFDRLRVTAAKAVEAVSLRTLRREGNWQTIGLSGRFEDGKPFNLDYQPLVGAGEVRMTSGDAGAMFELLDETGWVRGGRLDLSARRRAGDKPERWAGDLVIRDFVLTGAPRLVKALRLASLGSLSQELGGRGVRVDKLVVPFSYDGSTARLSGARAFGTGFGATADGVIDLDKETLDIDGTLIPAYPLNAALGQVPFVGFLFSGEKDGGLFAAPYAIRGEIEHPAFAVNPLGILTPGVFRNIFRIFDADRAETGSPPAPSGR